MEAHETQTALPLRAHTIFGVCEAIGEDFGFNPIFLRIPLAAMVVVNPLWAIGGYFALGLAVLASRLLFPKARPKPQGRSGPSRQPARRACQGGVTQRTSRKRGGATLAANSRRGGRVALITASVIAPRFGARLEQIE